MDVHSCNCHAISIATKFTGTSDTLRHFEASISPELKMAVSRGKREAAEQHNRRCEGQRLLVCR